MGTLNRRISPRHVQCIALPDSPLWTRSAQLANLSTHRSQRCDRAMHRAGRSASMALPERASMVLTTAAPASAKTAPPLLPRTCQTDATTSAPSSPPARPLPARRSLVRATWAPAAPQRPSKASPAALDARRRKRRSDRRPLPHGEVARSRRSESEPPSTEQQTLAKTQDSESIGQSLTGARNRARVHDDRILTGRSVCQSIGPSRRWPIQLADMPQTTHSSDPWQIEDPRGERSTTPPGASEGCENTPLPRPPRPSHLEASAAAGPPGWPT